MTLLTPDTRKTYLMFLLAEKLVSMIHIVKEHLKLEALSWKL